MTTIPLPIEPQIQGPQRPEPANAPAPGSGAPRETFAAVLSRAVNEGSQDHAAPKPAEAKSSMPSKTGQPKKIAKNEELLAHAAPKKTAPGRLSLVRTTEKRSVEAQVAADRQRAPLGPTPHLPIQLAARPESQPQAGGSQPATAAAHAKVLPEARPAKPQAPQLAAGVKSQAPKPKDEAEKVANKKKEMNDRLAVRHSAPPEAVAVNLPPVPAEEPKKDQERNDQGQPQVAAVAKPQVDVQRITVIDLRPASERQSGERTEEIIPAAAVEPGRTSVEVHLIHFDAAPRGAATTLAQPTYASNRSDAAAALQQNWGALANQIAKSTGIVLRDNNSGEIRLVLHPENLGSVRIRLDMKNDLVGARIVVDNDSVRQLFQQNMNGLERALRESGFQTGSLNVSVGGREGGFRDHDRNPDYPPDGAAPAVKSLSEHVPDMRIAAAGERLVNLVV